jgi:hypothetical protein
MIFDTTSLQGGELVVSTYPYTVRYPNTPDREGNVVRPSETLEAVPWLRWLATGLSPRRPGFAPRSIHVGFVVYKVTLEQVFSPSSSVFPCQYHSTFMNNMSSSGSSSET